MSGSKRNRAEALAVAGFAAFAGGAAVAQETAADAFEQGVVYVEADEVVDERDQNRYIARGAVEARYGDRIVRADEVIYYPLEERVLARGRVTIISDDGTVSYASEVDLAEDLTVGVVENFGARLSNDGKIGAAFALRTEDGNRLNRAYYTACEPCDRAGNPVRPTWRIRARSIRQDEQRKMIYYRGAVLEVKGAPVFYVPFMAHADPSAGRRSGFLLPFVGESSRTGGFYEQPYYWAISNSQDATIAPRFMTNANPLVSFEHRKRFFSGGTVFEGSVTSEREVVEADAAEAFVAAGNTNDEEFRGHIFGEGLFRIDDKWNWGFGVEAVSSDFFFQNYDIDDADKQRGLYRRGDKRLLNQLFVTRQTQDSWLSATALRFQGIQDGDSAGEIPLVAPLAEARRAFRARFVGGRVETRASVASLSRDDGVDSTRATVELDWRRRTVFKNGFVATPFAVARGDLYNVSDFELMREDLIDPVTGEPQIDTIDEAFARGFGFGGVEMSYPLGRRAGPFDLMIEPIAMLVAAPTAVNDERIPNEDSRVFDLDEAALLAVNRSPGFDITEEGSRATLGARGIARWGDQGGEASLFLGQSYRTERSDVFPESSGLDDRLSDFIGEARVTLNRSNTISARFRLDEEDMDIQRVEVTGLTRLGRARLGGRYLRTEEDLDSDILTNQSRREEAQVNAGFEITRNIGVYYQATRDLREDETRRAFAGLVYDDDCTRIELVYKQEETQDRAIGSGDSLKLQVTLKTIGSFGQNR